MNADTLLYKKLLKKKKGDTQTPAENFLRVYKNNFENSKKLNCLDLGCGNGRHTDFLLKESHSVLATDISKAAIELTKLRIPNFDNFYLYKNFDEFELFLSTSSFDIVVCWETIHFFKNLDEIIKLLTLIRKKLSKKGKLIITFPAEDHYLLRNKKDSSYTYTIKQKERKGMKITAPPLKVLKKIFKKLDYNILSIYKYSHGREIYNKKMLSMYSSSLKKLFSMYAFLLSA